MRTPFKITSLIFIAALFAACSPESASLHVQQPYVQPTPPVFDNVPEIRSAWVTEDGGQSQLDFNPQVDVLFVTDNSDSMKTAQSNLVRNMDKFSDGIVKNKMIDYHIGVISTWDSSERFATTKKDQYGIGELRFIKDSKNKSYGQRFVTRNEKDMMASTLDIGVAALADGGPENEEFFSPLIAALDKSGNGQANDGFFRKDAQLVVIFLTDADDGNSMTSVDELKYKLLSFKGDRADKLSVYGVLIKAGDNDKYKDYALRILPKYHPECFNMTMKPPVRVNNKNEPGCQTGFGPKKIEQLIVAANEGSGSSPKDIKDKYIMSIVSSKFGNDLANIGADIKVRTLAKEIFLTAGVPVIEKGVLQLRVRYGTPEELAAGKGQILPEGKAGWVYNSEKNSVRLSGNVNYQYKEGARFAVDLKPAILN